MLSLISRFDVPSEVEVIDDREVATAFHPSVHHNLGEGRWLLLVLSFRSWWQCPCIYVWCDHRWSFKTQFFAKLLANCVIVFLWKIEDILSPWIVETGVKKYLDRSQGWVHVHYVVMRVKNCVYWKISMIRQDILLFYLLHYIIYYN